MKSKQKICLNMIVKNEAHIIEETLQNICNYVDMAIISDTGSTDNTKKIILDFFKKKNKPCEIYDDPWNGFDKSRSKAIEHCYGKTDYIWIIDADDLVVGDLNLPKPLTHDVYMLKYGKESFRYWRSQIFKITDGLKWKYRGVIHEYPDCNKKNTNKYSIEGDYYIDSRRLGDRSKNPDKYLNDALIFEEALRDIRENPSHPDKDLEARYVFYMAQSYKDYNNLEKAYQLYEERTKMGGWYEEIAHSIFQMGKLLIYMKKSEEEIEKIFLLGHNKYPHRAECIYELATYFKNKKNFKKAYIYAKMAINISQPKDILFINNDIYRYSALDLHALCAYYAEQYEDAYDSYIELLYNRDIPKNHRKRLEDGLDFTKKKIDIIINKNKNSDTICVIYTNNILIDDNINNLIYKVAMHYNVYVVGNMLYTSLSNAKYIDINSFKILKDKMNICMLILYDNINYIYDIGDIDIPNVVLLQIDDQFKLYLDSNIYIECNNANYISKLLSSINYVLCDEKLYTSFSKKYKINRLMLSNNISDVYTPVDKKIFEVQLEDEKQFSNLVYPENLDYKNTDNEYCLTTIENMLLRCIEKYMIPELAYELSLLYKKMNNTTKYKKFIKLTTKLVDTIGGYGHLKNNIQFVMEMDNLEDIQIVKRFNIYNDMLRTGIFSDHNKEILYNKRYSLIEDIKDNYLTYPEKIINNIAKNIKTKKNINILFSITTCKRYDLFEKTMNSFLNCCLDIDMIDKFICVDDNSSEEDRKLMEEKYPFFTFIFKAPEQRGHCISMNIIHDEIGNAKYLLHMEDDFHFFEERNYITDSISILDSNNKYGQVLFNVNYAEYGNFEHYNKKCVGGINKRIQNINCVEHLYNENETDAYIYKSKHPGCLFIDHWPHFAFRPSVHKCNVWKDIGYFYKPEYKETYAFEMLYGYEYVLRGYKSVFLDTISCIHTGRKTWERNTIKDNTAYELNKQKQSEDNLFIWILSSNKELNRWKEFKHMAYDKLNYYKRYIIDNIKYTATENNRHQNNMKLTDTMIRYMIAHKHIWNNMNTPKTIEYEHKYVLVLDDTVKLCNNIGYYLKNIIKYLDKNDVDILFIGSYNQEFNDLNTPVIKKWNKNDDICGYILTKQGAEKLSKYVDIFEYEDAPFKFLPECSCLKKFYIYPYIVTDTIDLSIKYKHEYPGYKFYRGLDSPGGDIMYCKNKTIDELIEICNNTNNAIGFNTIGYIKHTISDIKNLKNLPRIDNNLEYGVYIKI